MGHVHEPRVVTLEGDGEVAGRAVAVLGHDEIGLPGARGLLLVHVFAMQQDHHVGVLLQRARLTKIADHRTLVGALFRSTVELGQRDDRDLELLGQELDLAGELETSNWRDSTFLPEVISCM